MVGVYKCLSLIAGVAVTVAICRREVVSCRDFILRAVSTFWAMSLVGIYLGRVSHPIRDGDGSENFTFKIGLGVFSNFVAFIPIC